MRSLQVPQMAYSPAHLKGILKSRNIPSMPSPSTIDPGVFSQNDKMNLYSLRAPMNPLVARYRNFD